MFDNNQIVLDYKSILGIPLQKYDNDFTFVVNGKLFKTSRIVADLLSPKIAQMHFNDPTSCEYSIQTNENGDFQKILNLINFERIDILPNEIPYIHEILEILDNQSIQIYNKNPNVIISLDYIFDNIQIHEN